MSFQENSIAGDSSLSFPQGMVGESQESHLVNDLRRRAPRTTMFMPTGYSTGRNVDVNSS